MKRDKIVSKLAALLVGLWVLASMLTPAPAVGQDAPPEAPPAEEAPEPGTLLDATRTSNTFAGEDGTLETVVYPGSVNFKDETGEYVPIDNTLVPIPGTDPGVENAANRYDAELPLDLSEPVEVTRPAGTVSLELQGASGAGDVSGETITYADVLPGVTVEYTASNDALKESIVLADPSTPTSFTFDLGLTEGLTAEQNADGGIDVRGANGAVQFSLLPPFLIDADQQPEEPVGPATMTLGEDGSSIRVAADEAWLADPARTWPVTIDPTIYTPNPTVDCHMDQGDPTQGFCSQSVFNVGHNTNGDRRGLLRFELSSIPTAAQVTDATLSLHLSSQSQSRVTTIELHEVMKTWDATATWTRAQTGENWSEAGGDFNDTIAASASVGDHLGEPRYTWDIDGLAQRWVSTPATNLGLLLKQPDDPVGNIQSFSSTENATQANWPKLTLQYALPQVAYVTCCPDGTDWEVFVANIDGTGVTRLTDNDLDESDASLSHDGTRALYEREGNIYTLLLATGVETRLTLDDTYFYYSPAWHPSGTKVAFGSDRDGNAEIYSMNLDGTGLTRLTTNTAEDHSPSWSPTGNSLAFTSDRDGTSAQLFTMNADGSGVSQLTSGASPVWEPSWSPDGMQIVYSKAPSSSFDTYALTLSNGQQTLVQGASDGVDNISPQWVAPGLIRITDTLDPGDNTVRVVDVDGGGSTVVADSTPSSRHSGGPDYTGGTDPDPAKMFVHVHGNSDADSEPTPNCNGDDMDSRVQQVINKRSTAETIIFDVSGLNLKWQCLASLIEQVSDPDVRLYGHVDTNYGARTKAAIKAEIRAYYDDYPGVDGIFFDQAPTTTKGKVGKVPMFRELYDYVDDYALDMIPAASSTVVLNPGGDMPRCYFRLSWCKQDLYDEIRAGDRFVIHEDSGAHFATWTPQGWVKAIAAGDEFRFWQIVHTVSTAAGMQSAIAHAESQVSGRIWVTNDDDYLVMPSYFNCEVKRVSQTASVAC